jgi:hypothetical protein
MVYVMNYQEQRRREFVAVVQRGKEMHERPLLEQAEVVQALIVAIRSAADDLPAEEWEQLHHALMLARMRHQELLNIYAHYFDKVVPEWAEMTRPLGVSVETARLEPVIPVTGKERKTITKKPRRIAPERPLTQKQVLAARTWLLPEPNHLVEKAYLNRQKEGIMAKVRYGYDEATTGYDIAVFPLHERQLERVSHVQTRELLKDMSVTQPFTGKTLDQVFDNVSAKEEIKSKPSITFEQVKASLHEGLQAAVSYGKQQYHVLKDNLHQWYQRRFSKPPETFEEHMEVASYAMVDFGGWVWNKLQKLNLNQQPQS